LSLEVPQDPDALGFLIRALYTAYSPEEVDSLDEILSEYSGREQDLLAAFWSKHVTEATRASPSSVGPSAVSELGAASSSQPPGTDSGQDLSPEPAATGGAAASVAWPERFRGCILLAAVGDAMGYKKGDWEFCLSSSKIYADLDRLTNGKGVLALDLTNWMVSDDTVMHLAAAEGLAVAAERHGNWARLDKVMPLVGAATKKCGQDFTGRAPGKSEQQGLKLLAADGSNWQAKPFDSRAVGCGAAMRAMAVGLCFPVLEDLVQYSVEIARVSKTHPTGYLGAVVAALFTRYALDSRPVVTWGRSFLEEALPAVKAYVLGPGGRHIEENRTAFEAGAFENKWCWYLHERDIASAIEGHVPRYPADYGKFGVRDAFYAEIAKLPGMNPIGKNPGSKGYDAVLIAYDALLWVEAGAGAPTDPSAKWDQLCQRAVLHRGDNDSTGSIAAAWYGALHGLQGVPKRHYEGIEYKGRCESVARSLCRFCSGAGH